MDQEIRVKLEQWIDAHFDDIIRDVSALVAVPSVSQKQTNPEAPYGQACREASVPKPLLPLSPALWASRRKALP